MASKLPTNATRPSSSRERLGDGIDSNVWQLTGEISGRKVENKPVAATTADRAASEDGALIALWPAGRLACEMTRSYVKRRRQCDVSANDDSVDERMLKRSKVWFVVDSVDGVRHVRTKLQKEPGKRVGAGDG